MLRFGYHAPTLENYEEVYNQFEEGNKLAILARLGSRALGDVIRPEVAYAEGVSDAIEQQIDHGTSLIVAANHQNNLDQCVLASVSSSESALKPLLGNTIIPARGRMFNNLFVRAGLMTLGSIPTYLEPRDELSVEELKVLRDEANEKFFDTATGFLAEGGHMAMFVEGKRIPELDASTGMQKSIKVRRGISEIVTRAIEKDIDVSVLPIGISYLGGKMRKPHVSINSPLDFGITDRDEIQSAVAMALQKAYNSAVQAAKSSSDI